MDALVDFRHVRTSKRVPPPRVATSPLLEGEPGPRHSSVILGVGIEPTAYAGTPSRACLDLRFQDVLDPRAGRITPASSYRAVWPSPQVRSLLSCRAGQGRSAALVYLIACGDRTPAEATCLLDSARHIPTRLVVKTGATALGDPEILGRFDASGRVHSRIRLSDRHDEIEAKFDELQRRGARNLTPPLEAPGQVRPGVSSRPAAAV